MQVKFFEELKDKSGLTELYTLCFDFPLRPEDFEARRRIDERLREFFALYAVEDGKVINQVGMMTFRVKTIEGVEEVGGLWGVCTHPKYSGRGVAKKLINEAHERFKECGVRMVFLHTFKTIVAYSLYLKLGYVDFHHLIEAFKFNVHSKPQLKPLELLEEYSSKYSSKLWSLHRRETKEFYGFTERQRNYVEVARAWRKLKLSELFILKSGCEVKGYIWVKRKPHPVINELVAPEKFKELIEAAESISGSTAIIHVPPTSKHVNLYESLGYKLTKTYGVLMVKLLEPLDPWKLLGYDKGLFYINSLDSF